MLANFCTQLHIASTSGTVKQPLVLHLHGIQYHSGLITSCTDV